MRKLMRLAGLVTMIAMAVPIPLSAQARDASGTHHFVCARYGLNFTVSPDWSQAATRCNSNTVQATYLSGSNFGGFVVTGVPTGGNTLSLLSLAQEVATSHNLSAKSVHASFRVINGVKFLITFFTGTNDVYPGSAWNLIAVANKNGLFLILFGTVNLSGRSGGDVSSVEQGIKNTLESIRFTTPGKAAKPTPALASHPILILSGNGPKQSETFHISGVWHLSWSMRPASGDAQNSFFAVYVNSADNLDELVNYQGGASHDTTTVHDNCLSGCYLSIDAEGIWSVTVTH
jgi:hypothetical protein